MSRTAVSRQLALSAVAGVIVAFAGTAHAQSQRAVRTFSPQPVPDRRVDPQLGQRNQTSVNPHRPPAGDEAPPAGWQLGTPVADRTGPGLLVPNGQKYLEQLPASVRQGARRVRTYPGIGDVIHVPQTGAVGSTGVQVGINGYTGYRCGYSPYEYRIGKVVITSSRPYWWGYRRGYYAYPQYHYGLVSGQYSPGYAPVPQAEEPAPELTTLERADLALTTERYEIAIEAYREHLAEEPEDYAVMRRLAVAMLGAKRFSDAESMMLYAHAQDPTLANMSLGDEMDIGELEHRQLINLAVRRVRTNPSGAGWLLIAVLNQARGEDEAALRFLKKAEDEGLDGDIARPLRVELTKI